MFIFDEPIHVYCFPPKRHEHERPDTRMACASAHTLSRKINGTKVHHGARAQKTQFQCGSSAPSLPTQDTVTSGTSSKADSQALTSSSVSVLRKCVMPCVGAC